MARDFSDAELRRYARHIVLKEVGGAGQRKLMDARVLVVGAGGLGSPVLLYLAAAGIGTLGIIDDDSVDISNLQRQIVHDTASIGRAKVDSAAASLAALNPGVAVRTYKERLNRANALKLIGDYDIVADGSDNFDTRFLLNDACYFARRPLVSAALLRFEGQLATFKAYLGGPNPCYRCLFAEAPAEGLIPSCSQAGIFGAVAGVMGTLQATEIIKEILGVGESLSGALLIYDALEARFTRIRVKPDPACRLCGPAATIRSLGEA